jgi:predicted AlkP superfamily phosphohydrolase/phosphomutase
MKLLVVGLDGVSYNMFEEFGVETPFLDTVRETGVAGDLRSVDTPTTLPAWTSFATGKDPGSHGIATMLQQDREYHISPATVNEDDRAAYDMIADALFVNLPGSVGRVPAADGTTLVSSFLSADRAEAVPEPLQDLAAYEEYVVHADEGLKSNPERYFQHLLETTEQRYSFAAEAIDRQEPRVGFVLFSTPDWVGHHLQFAPDDTTRNRWYRSIVERCDEYAAELASRAENVLLLSDHGFEHKPREVHLQTWLRERGYLVTTGGQSPLQRIVTGAAKQVAKRFDTLFDLIRTAYLRISNVSGSEKLNGVVDFNPDVDFPESRAWQLRYGCLHLNTDRFAAPTVADAETLRAELHRELAEMTDESGDPIFESVRTPEEVYSDPDPEAMLPDIVARPAPGVLPLRASSPNGDPVLEPPGHAHYDHRYHGVVAAEGPLFEPGTVEGMSIVDVLPTILHALSEPVPEDFDGDVRAEMLSATEPVSVADPERLPSPRMHDRDAPREAVAREQLRNLGYME